MDFQFKASGLEEAHRALRDLPVQVEKNILRGMIRAASIPVRDAARAAAPRLKDEDTRRVAGALARSVRIMSTLLKNGVVRGGVAAGSTKRTLKSAADAFYAKWVEYGRNGQAPQPFMRPAASSQTPAAIAAAGAYVRARVEAGDLKK